MELSVGDKVETKKPHPCEKKSVIFTVLRIGADIKLSCDNCGRELMMPRIKAEKMIKNVLK